MNRSGFGRVLPGRPRRAQVASWTLKLLMLVISRVCASSLEVKARSGLARRSLKTLLTRDPVLSQGLVMGNVPVGRYL